MARKKYHRPARRQNDAWKLKYINHVFLTYAQVDDILRGEGFAIDDGVEWVPLHGYRQSTSFTARHGVHPDYLKSTVISFIDNLPAQP